MTVHADSEDAEPLEPGPAGHALFVPVRPGPAGCTTRFFRTAMGGRTAVAFTSERALVRALGPDRPWIRLSEPALRALAEPLGVTDLRIDPVLSAPPAGVGAPAPVAPQRALA
ncbi:SAV_915 family protein [Actinacidiphila acididurans]|uniref:SseB protein N-terminal domain-containing protein n=1 Tax=Actinacidiphila acididurans TaxID=2784346 RepID=A0ABS2U3X1_9ACTN|nr:SAV_915 family protein [Actinacidiphila acididurans]MBM9510317.1 hypothetical protein [Actinacidiphila acididurans]